MKLPAKFNSDKLVFPFTLIHHSCMLFRNNIVGIIIIPMLITLPGIILHFTYDISITKGLWLALLWTSISFAMLYYGQWRIQNVFTQMSSIIPDDPEAKEKEALVQAKAFSHYNNKYYYIVGLAVVAIVLCTILPVVIEYYPVPLVIWAVVFFTFTAFVGGYGMACAVAIYKIVKEIIHNTPFTLNKFHPDHFLGLKPISNLSFFNGLVSASAALLFPIIFETLERLTNSILLTGLEYLLFALFATIFFAIILSFIGPMYLVKNKIEKEKMALIISHEKEYQRILEDYKKNPDTNKHDLLKMLIIERNKLLEIRLIPIDIKVIFEFATSIIFPATMLILELQKKGVF